MRIRKNAKISPLVYATSFLKPGTVIRTHDCQLNQSPWDVMDFSRPPSSPPPHPTAQADENSIYVENVSSLDCTPVVKSTVFYDASAKMGSVGKEFHSGNKLGEYYDTTTATADHEAEQPRCVEDVAAVIMCSKTDGKSWKCRREATKGNSLCQHHLTMVRGYNSSNHSNTKKSVPKTTVAAAQSRARPKTGPRSASSNPYQYYYYSGFGPKWSKKRGATRKDGGSEMVMDNENDDPSPSSQSYGDVDYEDEDEDEENGEYRKKKARKPIKERSLKSLM